MSVHFCSFLQPNSMAVEHSDAFAIYFFPKIRGPFYSFQIHFHVLLCMVHTKIFFFSWQIYDQDQATLALLTWRYFYSVRSWTVDTRSFTTLLSRPQWSASNLQWFHGSRKTKRIFLKFPLGKMKNNENNVGYYGKVLIMSFHFSGCIFAGLDLSV